MRPLFHGVLNLEIKSAELDKRAFRGFATTPAEDDLGDIIEPQGAEFLLPLPLLRQHRQAEPIGEVTKATATENGIEVEATGPTESGLAYLEEAWQQIRARLVKGLSVGFQPLAYEPILDSKGKATGGLHFTRWRWRELSVVTIPANQQASLTLRSLARGDFFAHDREIRDALLRSAPAAAESARDLARRNRAALALALADRALRGFTR